MIKHVSFALCCCILFAWSTSSTWAQGKAKVYIKKNINGQVQEETREIQLIGGEDIDAILRELGLVDAIGQLKPGQELEIKIDKTSPDGGRENLNLFFAPDAPEMNGTFSPLPAMPPSMAPQPFLGVMLRDEMGEENEMEGVWISDVVEGSVAQKDGLMTGDRILELDNEKVASSADVIRIVQSKQPGDKLAIKYQRADKTKTLKVKLGEKSPENNLFSRPPQEGLMRIAPFPFGIPEKGSPMEDYSIHFDGDSITLFCPSTPNCICPNDSMRICHPFSWNEEGMQMEERAYLGVSPNGIEVEAGVAVDVEAGTAAEKIGLQSGDIILQVDDSAIDDFDALAACVAQKQPEQVIVLDIQRNGRRMQLQGKLGKKTISQMNDFRIFHDFKGQDENGLYNYDFEFDMDQEDLENHMEEMLKQLDMRQLELDGERAEIIDELERLRQPSDNVSITIRIAEISSDDLSSVNANANPKLKPSNDLFIDQISFFPNPNDGLLNLSFTTADQAPVYIHVYDVNGQIVYMEELNEFSGTYSNQIDISEQPSGTYFLQIVQGQKSYSKKITKGK